MSKLGRYSANRIKYQEVTDTTYTATVADCGTLFVLNNSSGVAITLPDGLAAGAGWWATFTVDDVTADCTITRATSGDTIVGAIGCPDGTTAAGVTVATTVVTFDQSGGAAIGDLVTIYCDGAGSTGTFRVTGTCAT